ncbi:hypothetical protein N7447_002754 [Penicillium robsamsonii]|uniref:uncharacterized protein n=1 Tax=Penicillium robsamsonii TaxID=1792511 RepID=UPI002548E7E3|nr:uncharacterized protein N7447_002754 [Penicillium robsamsonii]KAJ5836728.1 hypothetical protein N7447_002754 [Penicillium robsamsonii]
MAGLGGGRHLWERCTALSKSREAGYNLPCSSPCEFNSFWLTLEAEDLLVSSGALPMIVLLIVS